jgi:cell division protein FtsB
MVDKTMWSKKHMIVSVLALLAVSGVLSAALSHGERGYFRYLALKQQKENLIQSNKEWQEKNRRLYEHIERLRHDLGYIEKIARQELGLVKEGELVYIFEPAAPETPP